MILSGTRPSAPRVPGIGLLLLALSYAGAMVTYCGLWLYATHRGDPPVELGFDMNYEPSAGGLKVTAVYPGSPAESSGLQRGDVITELDGISLAHEDLQPTLWRSHIPGDWIRVGVRRPGAAEPITLAARFRSRERRHGGGATTDTVARELLNLFPLPFVLVGATVLFLRPSAKVVWLLALLFGSYSAIPGFPDGFSAIPLSLRAFAVGFQAVMVSLAGVFFYWLFAEFPARSPIDRRLPWLKWLGIGAGLSLAAPALLSSGFREGTLRLPPPLAQLVGERASASAPFWFEFLFTGLGLASLAWSRVSTGDEDVRRRIRVIFWGTVAGVVPSLILTALKQVFAMGEQRVVEAFVHVVVLSLFPLSFAYAILRQRVLDIPVLFRRSARYLLVQRGFVVTLSAASVCLTVLFALGFTRYLQMPEGIEQPVGIGLGAVFGGLMLWGGTGIQRHVRARIDRAFFRSSYDARLILEDLARRTTTASGRGDLGRMLEAHLTEALHPSALSVYLAGGDDRLVASSAPVHSGPCVIAADAPGLSEFEHGGQCWEPSSAGAQDWVASSALGSLQPECVVPLCGHQGKLAGLFVLGPRLSEEPYSGEDKQLLLSVASQSAIALENFRMAEEIAHRIKAEESAAREIDLARQVQAKLLPQTGPRLATLDYAGRCVQARAVGGDYYDFLDLGPGRAGFVLADVSGKGFAAALLMAGLQASLRSQSPLTSDLPCQLQVANRLLYDATEPSRYATLFIGHYDDRDRRLQYANCGHNPPILIRADGSFERLAPTAMVIGLVQEWSCETAEVVLSSGDILVIYSDGITEAADPAGEEFGEARLVKTIRSHAAGAESLLAAVFDGVHGFSHGEQADDQTMVVGRVL